MVVMNEDRSIDDLIPLTRAMQKFWKDVIQTCLRNVERPTPLGNGYVRGKRGVWSEGRTVRPENDPAVPPARPGAVHKRWARDFAPMARTSEGAKRSDDLCAA